MAQNNGQAPAVVGARDGSAPKDIKALLSSETTRKRLSAIAAKHMDAERLMRISALAIHETPNLIKCNPMSLLGVIFECAQLGMEPNTALQHCHLVPYKKKKKTPEGRWVEEYDVELIIGYRGYIDLARRSRLTATIHADVVFMSDEFDYSYGSEQFLRHKPRLFDLDEHGQKIQIEDRGESIGYYAYCKLEGGEAFKVMSKADIIAIRDESQGFQAALKMKKDGDKKGYVPKGYSKCPWVAHFDSMGRKTPIRHLASELPLSIEFQSAVQVDGAQMDYASMANASDGEIVDLDPSHWQHQDEDDDEQPEGQPAGDDGPARVTQGADVVVDGAGKAKPAEKVDAKTGEVTEDAPPKAAGARRSAPADANLFPEG